MQSLWAYTPGIRAGAECGATATSPSKDTCSQPHKATMQGRIKTAHKAVMHGRIKTAAQSRCTMQRHKWLSMHRCNGTNGCQCTDAVAQMSDDLYGGGSPKARMLWLLAKSYKQGRLCQLNQAVMHRRIKTAAQSRCTMQRHKWLSMHRCNGTNS